MTDIQYYLYLLTKQSDIAFKKYRGINSKTEKAPEGTQLTILTLFWLQAQKWTQASSILREKQSPW